MIAAAVGDQARGSQWRSSGNGLRRYSDPRNIKSTPRRGVYRTKSHPKGLGRGGAERNEAINRRHKAALQLVRALQKKIKRNITSGNMPNNVPVQWKCQPYCQTVFFTAETPTLRLYFLKVNALKPLIKYETLHTYSH
jgi:hypothetical protein